MQILKKRNTVFGLINALIRAQYLFSVGLKGLVHNRTIHVCMYMPQHNYILAKHIHTVHTARLSCTLHTCCIPFVLPCVQWSYPIQNIQGFFFLHKKWTSDPKVDSPICAGDTLLNVLHKAITHTPYRLTQND